MASKEKDVKELQKKRFEGQLTKRITLLKEKGKSDAEIEKDSLVRKYKASIRDSINRIGAIAKKHEVLETAKKIKEEQKSQEKEKKKKGDKQGESEPAESKKSKNKKSKKES